ncbi:MAG: hypothetical protein K5773_07375, partial [Pseudobutyrivibrio sp.]|nr:hypothetical protein [Pseudobutyrivibrio sp.]
MEKRKNQGQELVEEFITGLYRWYPFRPGKSGLYVGTDDRISSMLKEYKKLDLRICSLEEVGNFNKQFDYIILQPDTVEKSRDLKELLELCHKNLAESGGLLFSVNNRLGIRYFCGDRDPYTDRIFDGLEDYIRAYGNPNNLFEGRCYDGAQVAGVLEEIGFLGRRRYSVFPDLENPTHIFADGYIPNENLRSRVFAQYNYPQSVFLEEENLWQGMIENGIFHAMANAFLFECKKEKANMSDALQVTNSLDRGPEKAMITVIHEGDKVTKEPAYIEGYNQIEALTANTEELKARGIPVVSGTLENHIYTMPLIHAKTG